MTETSSVLVYRRLGVVALGVVALGVVALALFPLFGSPALAWQYTNSKLPFWQVGSLNKTLSDACQRRRFNQVRPLRLTIGFNGADGNAVTGIAKMGWNLYDPEGLAQPGFTYHFYHDGFSDCKVFLAGSRLTR
ncbi:MAG: hypothetical protein V3R66_02145 [Rhodospirillales bacterium]